MCVCKCVCVSTHVYSYDCVDVTTALTGVGLVHRNEVTGRVDLDKGELWMIGGASVVWSVCRWSAGVCSSSTVLCAVLCCAVM